MELLSSIALFTPVFSCFDKSTRLAVKVVDFVKNEEGKLEREV